MSAPDDLKESLKSVHALIALEIKLDDPPSPAEKATSDGLRGAVVVLTLACFEGFLRTLFEEQLDRIVAAGIPLAHYSDTLRVAAVYNSLEFAHKGEPGQNEKRLERISGSVGIARSIGAGWFSPKAFSSTKSNPNAQTVAGMFGAAGKKEPWKALQAAFEHKWPEPVSKAYCQDKLNELVGSRNQVAHTAVSSHIVRSYLPETVAFISILGEVIAEELEQHIDSCIAEARQSRQDAESDAESA